MFQSLKEKIARSRNSFIGRIAEALSIIPKVDEHLMDELESILLSADVGPALSSVLIDELRETVKLRNITDSSEVMELICEIITGKLLSDYKGQKSFFENITASPHVILVIGVNGTGKTTSIGKIGSTFRKQGKSVLLIAADTFRAAAIEQLTIWSQRAGIDIFTKTSGTDPSSVIYDGLTNAKSKNYDIVLIDTAGRQHNKENLMNELEKIGRTVKKVIPDAPQETLLVLDSTTGQNAINQAMFFNKVIPVTGIVLTKFDGTSKGGVALAVKNQLGIPIKLIGVGETIEDLREFEAEEFAKAMMGS